MVRLVMEVWVATLMTFNSLRWMVRLPVHHLRSPGACLDHLLHCNLKALKVLWLLKLDPERRSIPCHHQFEDADPFRHSVLRGLLTDQTVMDKEVMT